MLEFAYVHAVFYLKQLPISSASKQITPIQLNIIPL